MGKVGGHWAWRCGDVLVFLNDCGLLYGIS